MRPPFLDTGPATALRPDSSPSAPTVKWRQTLKLLALNEVTTPLFQNPLGCLGHTRSPGTLCGRVTSESMGTWPHRSGRTARGTCCRDHHRLLPCQLQSLHHTCLQKGATVPYAPDTRHSPPWHQAQETSSLCYPHSIALRLHPSSQKSLSRKTEKQTKKSQRVRQDKRSRAGHGSARL